MHADFNILLNVPEDTLENYILLETLCHLHKVDFHGFLPRTQSCWFPKEKLCPNQNRGKLEHENIEASVCTIPVAAFWISCLRN